MTKNVKRLFILGLALCTLQACKKDEGIESGISHETEEVMSEGRYQPSNAGTYWVYDVGPLLGLGTDDYKLEALGEQEEVEGKSYAKYLNTDEYDSTGRYTYMRNENGNYYLKGESELFMWSGNGELLYLVENASIGHKWGQTSTNIEGNDFTYAFEVVAKEKTLMLDEEIFNDVIYVQLTVSYEGSGGNDLTMLYTFAKDVGLISGFGVLFIDMTDYQIN